MGSPKGHTQQEESLEEPHVGIDRKGGSLEYLCRVPNDDAVMLDGSMVGRVENDSESFARYKRMERRCRLDSHVVGDRKNSIVGTRAFDSG